MFQTLKNAWHMPELRKKILYTLFILLIFRFGSCIPVPFIDTQMLDAYFQTAARKAARRLLPGPVMLLLHSACCRHLPTTQCCAAVLTG